MADVLISIGALCSRYGISDDELSNRVVEKVCSTTYRDEVYEFCEEQGVDVRVKNCMLRINRPLEWFATASEEDFWKIRNAGKKTVEELLRLQKILRDR